MKDYPSNHVKGTPLVTIAIPTRNRRELLSEAVESALAQDYPNLDILVSDNGSSDDTSEYIRSLQRRCRNLRFRRTPAPASIPQHFNQCVDSAEGEYFVLLSDDDRINPEFVSSLISALQKCPGASAAIPANIIVGQDGRVVTELPRPDWRERDGIDFAIEWLWKSSPLPVANLVSIMAPTALVRRFRYQLFPKGLNADNLLFLQLAISGKVLFDPGAVFYFRVHQTSAGRRVDPAAIGESARSFLRCLWHDPRTVDILRAHPPEKQKAVRSGVRFMTGEEFLHAIGFFQPPFSLKILRHLFAFRLDPFFIRLVLRHTARRILQAN